ncbi:hypothetical protein M3B61_10790 [Micrococcus luteus]|nr:hypothetical protein [Micrococcus luteus]MCV7584354.1 hypothetical protein [Micrococcus luteus]MCV7589049.1 hypothetical protein [Micrococcus luteus]
MRHQAWPDWSTCQLLTRDPQIQAAFDSYRQRHANALEQLHTPARPSPVDPFPQHAAPQ